MGHSAYKLIAVKIGSNVLTRRDGTLDITRMSALVDQVAEQFVIAVDELGLSHGRVQLTRRHGVKLLRQL